MKRFAHIIGSTVAVVVESDDVPAIPGQQWVECGNAGPGWVWDGAVFSPPTSAAPSWSDQALDGRYWWIDVGPFFDRFGLKALGVVSSTDPVVQGVVTLCMPRQYIDLKRPDLPSMLDVLVSKSLITAAEKTAILTGHTNDYERHIKGLPQPL